MARPKRIEGEPTARQRMEDAFWGMLADMPYHKMTSREVCKRSGVSHNSFYYHFENLDDMARQMLNGLFVPELPLALLSVVDGSGETAARLERRGPHRPHVRHRRHNGAPRQRRRALRIARDRHLRRAGGRTRRHTEDGRHRPTVSVKGSGSLSPGIFCYSLAFAITPLPIPVNLSICRTERPARRNLASKAFLSDTARVGRVSR